jgi:hypothetical protein
MIAVISNQLAPLKLKSSEEMNAGPTYPGALKFNRLPLRGNSQLSDEPAFFHLK